MAAVATQRGSDDWVIGAFQRAAERVPAYRRFLTEARVDPRRVTSLDDLRAVPPITAGGYLASSPFRDLLVDGKVSDGAMLTAAARGHGDLGYRVSGRIERARTAHALRRLLADLGADARPTLALNAHASDLHIAEALRDLCDRGYRLAGIAARDVEASVGAIQDQAPRFAQTLLFGAMADVDAILGRARTDQVDLRQYFVRVVLSAEVLSHAKREQIAEQLGGDPADCVRVLYEPTCVGPLAAETQATATMRRSHAWRRRYGDVALMPLALEYDPNFVYFESRGRDLLLTCDGNLPLIRYSVGAVGRPLSAVTARRYIALEADAHGFVIHRGVEIAPDAVRLGLREPDLAGRITGRFTMCIEHTADAKPHARLCLVVECTGHPFNDPGLADRVRLAVNSALTATNVGYRWLRAEHGPDVEPDVRVVEPGDPYGGVPGRWLV